MVSTVRTLLMIIFSAAVALGASAEEKDRGEWPAYGRTPGGHRHSPLKQIHSGNVTQLEEAWTYRTGELARYEGTETANRAAFEATPIMVERTLYFCTPTNRLIALDAASGREKWTYDAKIDLNRGYSETTCRGVSTWADPKSGRRSLYMGTIDFAFSVPKN